jgi:hypothetical protein
MQKPTLGRLLCALSLLLPLAAGAENSTSVEGYTVHHNAFTSDTLTPDVASAYGIQRSKYRGLLNVSVIKEAKGTTGTPVPAQVEAKIVTLTGQTSPLAMREIKEGNEAVYYIGEFPVHDEQTLDFVIEVIPQGAKKAIMMRMDQQFFTD